jgi:cell division protein FtsB
MRKNKKTINFNYYIFGIITAIIIGMVVFNDFGLITYFKLKERHRLLDHELSRLLLQQNELRSKINKLQTNQEYIEKIAREKFMMVKPGERIYRVKETKEIVKN